jgi:hypothetical protein
MIKFKLFLIFLIFTFFSTAYSQPDSVFMLPQLKIYQRENGKNVIYSFEQYRFNKFSFNGNYLIADTHRYKYKINIDDIRQVSFRDGNNGWTMAGYGAALGFVLGFFAGGYFDLSENPHKEFHLNQAIPGGLIFALPFGLFGGLIGLLSPDYDDYDLSKINKDYKPSMLKNILKKNRIKTL